MATETECLRALRAAADRLDESPTKAQYESLGVTPAASTVIRQCGGWNAAKARAGLSTNPSRGSRVRSKPDDVDLPDGVAWDDLTADQRWHYRHPTTNTERSRERRRQLRAWVRDRKRARGGCARCVASDPACLDFHHPDRDTGTHVSTLLRDGASKATLRAEMRACVLLCANCHWRTHNPAPAGSEAVDEAPTAVSPTPAELRAVDADLTKAERLRARTYAYQREWGCRDCATSDPVCLQLHHVDGETVDGVGAMIGQPTVRGGRRRGPELRGAVCELPPPGSRRPADRVSRLAVSQSSYLSAGY